MDASQNRHSFSLEMEVPDGTKAPSADSEPPIESHYLHDVVSDKPTGTLHTLMSHDLFSSVVYLHMCGERGKVICCMIDGDRPTETLSKFSP